MENLFDECIGNPRHDQSFAPPIDGAELGDGDGRTADRKVGTEEKPAGDPVLPGDHEAVVELPGSVIARREIGKDVVVLAHEDGRLLHVRLSEVGDDDLQVGKVHGDPIEQAWVGELETARVGAPAVKHHRHVMVTGDLVKPPTGGTSGVHRLVRGREFQTLESQGQRRLEVVAGVGIVGMDRTESDRPSRVPADHIGNERGRRVIAGMFGQGDDNEAGDPGLIDCLREEIGIRLAVTENVAQGLQGPVLVSAMFHQESVRVPVDEFTHDLIPASIRTGEAFNPAKLATL